MGNYSPYDMNDSDPPRWRPGEEQAACGMIAIVLWLFFDVNVGIYRAFKKKHGLYFWSMLLGTWGCLLEALGMVLKFFLPARKADPIWPLAVLFIELGWTMYIPSELLVLYSRLHLVNQNIRLQRWVLILIISTVVAITIPSWIFFWPANDPYNQHLSSLYSPRQLIMVRCSQLAYTLVEVFISAIYIQSLLKLLRVKSSIRQRRVMIDLIYVVIIAVCVDIVTMILIYLNQPGIGYPNQVFSYMLKFKLEFVVLNQLMAVAARGIKRESFSERRYHLPSLPANGKHPNTKLNSGTARYGFESSQGLEKVDSVDELVVPSPVLSRVNKLPSGLNAHSPHGDDQNVEMNERARVKKHGIGGKGEEDEEEEISVNMWERRGNLIMQIPWFRKDGKDVP